MGKKQMGWCGENGGLGRFAWQCFDFDGLRALGGGFDAESDQLAAAQGGAVDQRPTADEDLAAVGGGDEADAFAPIVPFDRAALPAGEGQQMAAARAVGRLGPIQPLFPTRPDEADAAVVAGEGAVGGEKQGQAEGWCLLARCVSQLFCHRLSV